MSEVTTQFVEWLKHQAGDPHLKVKAVMRYKEHVRACAASEATPEEFGPFWHEISHWPELAKIDEIPRSERPQTTALGRMISMTRNRRDEE